MGGAKPPCRGAYQTGLPHSRGESCPSSTAVAHRATGDLHQRSGGTSARALVHMAAEVPPSCAIGVGRAAAVWLHARIGARCPMHPFGASHSGCSACLPRATGSIFGMNSGSTQRAVELAATDPANRARLGRCRELGERRRPKKLPRRAAFEQEPGKAGRCPRAVRRSRDDPVCCTQRERESSEVYSSLQTANQRRPGDAQR